jgi:protein ImuA
VDQAASSPIPLSARLRRISPLGPNPSLSLSRAGLRSCPNRNGEPPFAVPEAGAPRAALLDSLRARIHAIERHPPSLAPVEGLTDALCSHARSSSQVWTLGVPEIDRHLRGGLDEGALHEVKPERRQAGAVVGDWATALGFVLRLTVRRLHGLGTSASGTPAQVLWCWPSALAHELGRPYGPGLSCLGLEPSSCLFVETARASDALWAMEEGLKSASVALVLGVLKDVELTPARRLSLAAAEHRIPCLLLTDPRTPPTGATATRWRIGGQTSALHPFEVAAPGPSRHTVSLKRCRHGAPAPQSSSLILEWSNETHRFRMVSALADRAATPYRARRRA